MSSTDRQRRWRERQRGMLDPLPQCPECGARITTRSASPHASSGLCSACWMQTDEGREYDRARHSNRPYGISCRGDQWILYRVKPWSELMTFDSLPEAYLELSRLLTTDEPTTPSRDCDVLPSDSPAVDGPPRTTDGDRLRG